MNVLRIVGPSDAGKTTLVEELVGRLDCRVATVKSIHHDVEPDTPGKDTYRHRDAGADATVGVTPSRTFRITEQGKGNDEVETLYRILGELADDGYDVTLVEGFSAAALPAVVLGGREVPAEHVVARGDRAGDVDVDTVLTWLETAPPALE
ncbi:molybdopterin-guanine dinucleotide biosynthesis protein B [Natrialbaceae archaeon AArc-T1-2]|uniref:molybdopterin-guanine dinucleotide biosynthesis protein B n=1 Tax=Natrialbaceae archaeon AArc-T1-2 TaxID=3053904 RepID=UPI00255B2CEF|nr:molybdopterin-guanine dinucleotide biosynthesis protein B [Natrialbaceae archaeon AArc-T1-2]WIV66489.1 molybdopterin-guanine dinucleotide biosynthesis protein B [Natrialbaceae archaeon AArc-T1-2]